MEWKNRLCSEEEGIHELDEQKLAAQPFAYFNLNSMN